MPEHHPMKQVLLLARAAGEIFHWSCIKHHKSRLLDVHMHPNKFRCAWLGQGSALKVVLKGFEGAMMLGEKKSIDQKFRFCRKRAKNWEICDEL